ncbi:MAG: DUF1858 domain-containing protein [Phycisphaeraceae bacterium]
MTSLNVLTNANGTAGDAAPSFAPGDTPGPDTMLPDLFLAHPRTRPVFDRYGLRGCGGTYGPRESIRFFAQTHGVDEASLLEQIQRAIVAPEQPDETGSFAGPTTAIDAIYRHYFLGGIAVILTVGALWGALLLWKIGFAGSFTGEDGGPSIFEVNAHGHAQIFGWVGLFIMGFAYQAFPRMWHTDLAAPRLAFVNFLAMLVGIAVRTAGMTWPDAGGWTLPAAVGGGALEIAAVTIFAGQILLTFRRSGKPVEPYVGFIVAALCFLVAQAVFSLAHTWNTMTAATEEDLLWFVATYQAPLRDVQIHGLALLMILGVSLRMLPAIFGVGKTPSRRAWVGLGLLLAAIVGETSLFITYRHTGNHALAGALLLPWLLLPIGVGLVAWPWKLWRPMPDGDRSAKFVRAAYAWLAFSLAMLLALPIYQIVSTIPFSHAYYGAIRHAITVGFISMMIMGFAARVVPTLSGIDTRRLTGLWGPFILINLGCFLRVSLQTGTDWHPAFFALVGVSGLLEVTALAWWGIHLVQVIRVGRRAERQGTSPDELDQPPARIEPEHKVADVLGWFPHLEPVFVAHGFAAVRNPVLRHTVARATSLRQAAAMHGVNLEQFLDDLRTGQATNPASPA